MNLQKRIAALVYLGQRIASKDEQLLGVQQLAKHKNNWFTQDNTDFALAQIAENYLEAAKLEAFVAKYEISTPPTPLTVGVIMAGSPPLVGFQDLLMVFLSGHIAQVKLSEDDKYLIPHLVKIMREGFPEIEKYILFEERLRGFDAVLTSGNQDAITIFERYFSKIPHLIRKYRTGVSVLLGNETQMDLDQLGKDIFQYFGLNPRSVSKIFVPEDYDFVPLLEATHAFNEIVLHHKYKNNFDYNYTLHILNSVAYKANGCLMLIEDQALQSRIATLHYEVFKDENHLNQLLQAQKNEIQHIISNKTFPNFKNKTFGSAHLLHLADYDNGIDTMLFLKKLK
ncbi:MAG: acyl-CoA reductase [Bacteroidota bacterium]